MAAETSLPSINHALAGHPRRSPPLDPAITTLLEQQAEISAKLAVLLPQDYGFDTKAELMNLRHKLRILQKFASDCRLPLIVPVLSNIEEARQLEYQIECIETVCLDQGQNLDDPRIVDALDSIYSQDAPSGFSDWLRRNLVTNDPTIRAWKQRNTMVAQAKEQGYGDIPLQRPSPEYRSLKCPDEGCIHYIYGFLHQIELDQHCQSHAAQLKRDSALSVGGGSTPLAPLFFDQLRHRPSSSGYNYNPPPPTPPLAFPSPFRPASIQLPPLMKPAQKRDHNDSLRSYSLTSNLSAQPRPVTSSDVEADPMLPPLKRSRIGPSRLESIGELRLSRETDACLSCKYLEKECDSNNPCSCCSRNANSYEHASFWACLGCHRGPLAHLAGTFVPDFLGSRRAQTPVASPHAQRQNINDFLERTYWCQPEPARVVRTNLDFEDGFWWTEDLTVFPSTEPTLAPFLIEPKDQPPPILRVLASSQNMAGSAYNFWQLLKLSGLLSVSRGAEASSFPALYHAKLLLREVLFFDLQQAQPAVVTEPAYPNRGAVLDAYEHDSRHRIVRSCAAKFLQSFEHVVLQGKSIDPRTWLATFFSLCIFSIIRTLLVDMALQAQPADESKATAASIHAVYKVTATMFSVCLPPLLDGLGMAMGDEDGELYNTASMIIKRSIWFEGGMASTADFLLHLGDREMEGGGWHGFIRQRSFVGTRLLSNGTQHSGEQQQLPGSTALWDPATSTPLEAAEAWTHLEARTLDREAASTQSGTLDDRPSVCGHALPGGVEGPAYVHRNDKPPMPPMRTLKARPPHRELPVERPHCTVCNEHPDGFHGEVELREHARVKHSHLANLAKGYMCVEPAGPDRSDRAVLDIPLSECWPCTSKKKYASFHDAVAHLRQAHFNSRTGGTTSDSEVPPLYVLGKWTREIRLFSGMQDTSVPSKREEPLGLSPSRLLQPCSAPPPEQRFPPTNGVPGPGRSNVTRTHPPPLLPLQDQTRQSSFQAPPLGEGAGVPIGMGIGSSLASPRVHLSPMPIPLVQTKQPLPSSPMPLPSGEAPEPITMGPGTDIGVHYAHPSDSRNDSPLIELTLGTGFVGAKPEDIRHGNRNRCPYPDCGRVFKDLPAHMLTHMEERPEKCPIETCEYHTKGFARKYDKNRHALTHYKGTMVCPFCHRVGTDYEKAFNRADVFKRHLTAVHNVEQTPPNSKKSTAVSAGNHQSVLLADRGSGPDALARCSICHSQFISAQDFYEHLDDCVLNVIVPSAPKNAGKPDYGDSPAVGESPADPVVPGASKPPKATKVPKAAATKTTITTIGLGGGSSKTSPVADAPSAVGADRVDRLQGSQPDFPILPEAPPREPLRGSAREALLDSLPGSAARGGDEHNRERWYGGYDGGYGFHREQQRHKSDGERPDMRTMRPELAKP